MTTKFESINRYGKFWLDEHHIFNLKYHSGAVIDLEAAQFLVQERLHLLKGESYPLLVDMRGIKFISNQALNYFASKDSFYLIPAGALLKNSFLSKIFSNCFINLYTPKVPTRAFTDKSEAINWLLKFQQHSNGSSEDVQRVTEIESKV